VLQEGFVLVRNSYSLISPGTEGGTVKLGKASLLGKAKARPEQVKKVLRSIQSEGLLTTYQFVRNSLDLPNPLGYCCAGEVIAVGDGVESLRPGDRVACGGGGHAVHAEVVSIPKNLCVPVPEGLDLRWAAFTTLGSIAMQSLRVAEVTLGSNVVVIGLGLVGLLTCRLLKAAGCHVFGIELDEERVRFATTEGFCERACVRRAPELMEQVGGWSSGRGADALILTAATPNNDPVALAGELARPKAKVVVVGRTQMEAPRDTYLFKELELRTSLAYGPGTGDLNYEARGQDYPLAYVRWTEGRNMEAFARLAADGRLGLESLITHELPIDEAPKAFELIGDPKASGALGVVLGYPDRGAEALRPTLELGATRFGESSAVWSGKGAGSRKVRIGVVGAGSFATNVMIPTLAGLPGVEMRSIASAKGIRARSLGSKYGFRSCTGSAAELIGDPEIDLVVILTRHDTHAPLATQALKAGKAVFVEKPLAMDEEELAAVQEAHRQSGRPLMVGFNRRYAELAVCLKELFARRAQPLSISYLANVGYRPPEHWLHDPKQGGGVVLGEACHFIDFCHWLTESRLVDLRAMALRDPDHALASADNVHLQMSFADGSVASVRYLSNGNPAMGRERAEVLGDKGSAVLEDFRLLEWASHGQGRRRKRAWIRPDKGYRSQLLALVDCVRQGKELPHQDLYFLSSQSTLRAVRALSMGRPVADDG
jgi:predicted dehydrogenase/threonine dehydrogenase-like Zn-dependent dehydrogenase